MRSEDRETSRSISLKRAGKLQQKKHRETEKLFLAEGRSLIEESSGSPRQLFEDPNDVRRLSALKTPTGPVGVFPFLDISAGDLVASCDRIILLHGVQDPGNVGTIIRVAHAFGAGVALSGGCADLYNPKTVRATMGSIFHAPLAREVETLEFLESARSSGFTPVAAALGGGCGPREMSVGKLVVVVGPEGAGLQEAVVAACEQHVEIPSRASSLNVAMAATILLYEAYMRVLP
ncbi:MAG TPA: RNA methyltransferase [Rubrobacteraceae bacterium]|nr:RNA methyltransferase [Rubrobacteraceae bacterium]